MSLLQLTRRVAVWVVCGVVGAGAVQAQHHGGGGHMGGGHMGGGHHMGGGMGGGHHYSGGGGGYSGGGGYRGGGYYGGYGLGSFGYGGGLYGSGLYGSGLYLQLGRPYGYGNTYYTRPQYDYNQPGQVYAMPAQTVQYPQQATKVSDGDVTVLVPSDDPEAAVDYTLNGYPYSMRTGQAQTFPNDRLWTIEFNRGGNFGQARYSLSPGTFKFKQTDKGWELMRAAVVPPMPAQPETPTPATTEPPKPGL